MCVCVCVLSYHQSVLPKGRSFTANSRTKVAVLFKDRSSTANSETKVSVLVASRCFPHPTLSLPSERTLKDLKRPQGPPEWRRGEWIWLTGSSGLHRNLPQELNISSIKVFDQSQSPFAPR